MSLESAITFFLAVLLFSVTPGPGVFAILARALTNGTRACVLLALGMTLSDLAYLLAACFGLALLATHYTEVFLLIRLIGAAYLVYLGWRMWMTPVQSGQPRTSASRKGDLASLLQGFLISAANPKVILFYMAFLPTFMDLTTLNTADMALVGILAGTALMLGLMTIAGCAARVRHHLQSEPSVRTLNRCSGSVMIGAGVYLAAQGFS